MNVDCYKQAGNVSQRTRIICSALSTAEDTDTLTYKSNSPSDDCNHEILTWGPHTQEKHTTKENKEQRPGTKHTIDHISDVEVCLKKEHVRLD